MARAAARENRSSLARSLATRGNSVAISQPRSSRRSASAGSSTVNPARRANRSWRNVPASTRCSRSWWVAAITRTLTLSGRVPPTGVTSRSWSTRSSAACDATGSSATSSRNKVPRSALLISPTLSRSAPENAPRLWPNSWLSSRFAGIAPQLTATMSPRRPEARWIALATTSFPVPEAPRISSGVPLGATRCSSDSRAASGGFKVVKPSATTPVRSRSMTSSSRRGTLSRNRISVPPISMTSPSRSGASVTGALLTKVPFLEPLSRTRQPLQSRAISACEPDMKRSPSHKVRCLRPSRWARAIERSLARPMAISSRSVSAKRRG